MNHTAASTVKVVTEGLLLDHGETETRPMPAPSATNAKENAAATNAPAKTAAHDTPDTVSTAVTVAKGPRAVTVACVICSTSLTRTINQQAHARTDLSFVEGVQVGLHRSAMRVMIGIGTPRSQSYGPRYSPDAVRPMLTRD